MENKSLPPSLLQKASMIRKRHNGGSLMYEALTLLANGHTTADVSHALNVPLDTLYLWIQNFGDPETMITSPSPRTESVMYPSTSPSAPPYDHSHLEKQMGLLLEKIQSLEARIDFLEGMSASTGIDDEEDDSDHVEANIDTLYNVSEAAAYLDISKLEMYQAVRDGEIEPYRAGKAFYFSEGDLDEYYRDYYEEIED